MMEVGNGDEGSGDGDVKAVSMIIILKAVWARWAATYVDG
jgi:hypothetical protein